MTLTNEEVVDWLNKFESEAKAVKDELLRVCWYMRGSISYEDSFFLSIEEKEMISKIIKENLDTTKETGLPFI